MTALASAQATTDVDLLTLTLHVSDDQKTWHPIVFEGESPAYVDKQAAAWLTHTVTAPELLDVTAQLPEPEWCPFCSYDETSEPGLPRDIVKRTVEPALPPEDWDPSWGQNPLYEVTYLSCGHTLAELCESAAPRSTPKGPSPCTP